MRIFLLTAAVTLEIEHWASDIKNYFLYFSLNCLSNCFSATKGNQIHIVLLAPFSKKSASDCVKKLKATYKTSMSNKIKTPPNEVIYFSQSSFGEIKNHLTDRTEI